MILEEQWAKPDKAYAKGQQAYIEFGQALAQISATQQEIADRYDMDQSKVSRCIAVGKDVRIMRISHKLLPKSTNTLDELTTLDDKAFEELAKPETRYMQIVEYKRRLKAPEMFSPDVPPVSFQKVSPPPEVSQSQAARYEPHAEPVAPVTKPRPPCPGVIGDKHGEYEWSEKNQLWMRMHAPSAEDLGRMVKPDAPSMSVAEAEKIMGIYPMTKDVLQAIFRYQASVNHPDKGGDTEKMSLINKAYERLQNDYF
jgi:hypothetical protein